jgi:hypothetical protein
MFKGTTTRRLGGGMSVVPHLLGSSLQVTANRKSDQFNLALAATRR